MLSFSDPDDVVIARANEAIARAAAMKGPRGRESLYTDFHYRDIMKTGGSYTHGVANLLLTPLCLIKLPAQRSGGATDTFNKNR